MQPLSKRLSGYGNCVAHTPKREDDALLSVADDETLPASSSQVRSVTAPQAMLLTTQDILDQSTSVSAGDCESFESSGMPSLDVPSPPPCKAPAVRVDAGKPSKKRVQHDLPPPRQVGLSKRVMFKRN